MYFYQRLRDMREDQNMTQRQVGALLGVTQQQYARWELGKQELPMHLFIILAKFYNTSLDYLAGLTDTPRTISGEPYRIGKQTAGGHITNIQNSSFISVKN